MNTMMKGENSAEVEIDLEDSSDPDEYDNGEEPETLWRAPPALEEEEDIHTSTLVEISDTKPLINVRDPRGINDCLKVTFEDVIAEPVSVRSGDRVWTWSNALFEVMVGPCSHCILIGARWLQSLWSIVLGVIVRPFLTSAGRCCGGFSIHLAKE
ncbi:hypothetical protein FQN60_009492 [Etheostoma spectabile]|uniref:Caveolin n=1 Tax=Etheostoma spectabile TaxID=54343 RepID=A0A5J5DIZ9_9PERO|nr:hypothetical protein FQN60_009492 [Etheostoma spectabile]